ncbi:hypothetical protein B2K_12075 [Paenibacillus mucilaginosus K02]|nr:hypothetical protein B2K_12075 [Paenibacillus mucilaginosus K02]
MNIKSLIQWLVFMVYIGFISKYGLSLYLILILSAVPVLINFLLSKASSRFRMLNKRFARPVMIGAAAAGSLLILTLIRAI